MRPLTLNERLTVTQDPCPSQNASMRNVVLRLAFLLGQCVGPYATASCHLKISEEPGTQTLKCTVEITVPLEELSA